MSNPLVVLRACDSESSNIFTPSSSPSILTRISRLFWIRTRSKLDGIKEGLCLLSSIQSASSKALSSSVVSSRASCLDFLTVLASCSLVWCWNYSGAGTTPVLERVLKEATAAAADARYCIYNFYKNSEMRFAAIFGGAICEFANFALTSYS